MIYYIFLVFPLHNNKTKFYYNYYQIKDVVITLNPSPFLFPPQGRVGCASKAGHRGGGSLAGLARVLKGLHDEGRLGHALGNAVGTRERVRVAMGVGAEGRVWVQVAVVGEVDVTTEAAVLAR